MSWLFTLITFLFIHQFYLIDANEHSYLYEYSVSSSIFWGCEAVNSALCSVLDCGLNVINPMSIAESVTPVSGQSRTDCSNSLTEAKHLTSALLFAQITSAEVWMISTRTGRTCISVRCGKRVAANIQPVSLLRRNASAALSTHCSINSSTFSVNLISFLIDCKPPQVKYRIK